MRMRSRWLALAVLSLLSSGSVAYGQRDPMAFTSLGTLNVTSGTLNINTDTLTMSGVGASFTGVMLNQSGGMQVAVFDFSNITIGSGVTISVTGERALSLLSRGNISINSNISLNAGVSFSTSTPGPGGYAGAHNAGGNSGFPMYGTGPGAGGYLFGTQNGGLGAGFGGVGGGVSIGSGSSATYIPGGASYGNLFSVLQGGSGGGLFSNGTGGGGGGAIEIGAIGSVSVTSVSASGQSGANGFSTGSGGGAGGGIILSGSSISYTSLSANGGNSSANPGTGGGGGRVALAGIADYTLGTSIANVSLTGGTSTALAGFNSGYAGVTTVDAIITRVSTGSSILLNGNPITSIAGSTTRTGATVEAYVRKDLVIESGGTATLGMDNALRRLDASGNNITELYVGGTFNTGAFNQIVSELFGNGTINLNTGGSLTVGENNGFSIFSGVLSGNGRLNKVGSGPLTLGFNSINYTGPTTIQDGTLQFAPAGFTATVSSSISGAGELSVIGTGSTLILTGNNTYTGKTFVSGATLKMGSSNSISSLSRVTVVDSAGSTFDTNGYNVSIAGLNGGGASGGTVIINGGTLSLTPLDSITFNGSVTGSGNLAKSGVGTQVLNGTNTWTGTTTVQLGNLQFNSPLNTTGGIVRVEGSGTLQANASITRPILGNGPGSTITVGTSGITLGDATSFIGFNHQGILNVNANAVTLASAAQPRLGSLTTLGAGGNSGTINSSKGVYVDFANALIGYGTVNSPNTLAERTIVNGIVQGNSTTEPITFTGWVKGVGTFNNVVFAGTWDPGFSPTLITAGSLGFSSTNNLIMELGGLSRGSQSDGIDAAGAVNVAGTLSVARINGFSPNIGDAFVLVNRAGGTGTFIGLNEGDSFYGTDGGLYVISYQGINYMTNQLANGADGFSIVIAAVPEPATWVLMGLGLAGGSWFGYRRLRQRTQALDTEVSTELEG